jgi:hypothetical protein
LLLLGWSVLSGNLGDSQIYGDRSDENQQKFAHAIGLNKEKRMVFSIWENGIANKEV